MRYSHDSPNGYLPSIAFPSAACVIFQSMLFAELGHYNPLVFDVTDPAAGKNLNCKLAFCLGNQEDVLSVYTTLDSCGPIGEPSEKYKTGLKRYQ